MFVRILLLASLAMVCGCTTTVIPPAKVADPVPAYLVDYGRHSSVMVRVPGGVREFCFGDFNWFAINRNKRGDALKALFNSAGSTLGRRSMELPDDVARIKSATNAHDVFRMVVEREKAAALLLRLDGIFEKRLKTLTYNPVSEVWFVRTEDRYSAWHNCNHVTNRWLHALGVKTRGVKMFSRFKLHPADGAAHSLD